MAAADGGRTSNAGVMIRMSDIASALELFKHGRVDSANSLSSWATTAPTPPTNSPAHPSSTSSPSSSASTSPCSSVRGGSVAGGRGVRFADECGGDLVSHVRTTTDWWEEMVFGNDRCEACGHRQQQRHTQEGQEQDEPQEGWPTRQNSADSTDARDAEDVSSDEVGLPPFAAIIACQGCGACRSTDSPSDLFQFIEMLSAGVEATLVSPGVVGKKRRPVILYTEDNGESLCWMKTGSGRTANPYRLPCKTLLEVRSKVAGKKGTPAVYAVPASPVGQKRNGSSIFRASRQTEQSHSSSSSGHSDDQGAGEQHGAAAGEGAGGGSNTLSRKLDFRNSRKSGGGLGSDVTVFSGSSVGSGGSSCSSVSAADDAAPFVQRDCNLRIKLRWRLKPTWSAQTVTIENVRCSSPAIFSKGMSQLRNHNTDLMR